MNNGTKAVEVAHYFRPDIIFLDVVMPEIDGGDVARLRVDPELATVPIVFLTAVVSAREASHQSAIGGFPFLAKPVSINALVKEIETCCP